jgi:hypothetical protein
MAADDQLKGIRMTEGRWIFDVRIQMPMQAKPLLQKLQTCVADEPITAETLMPWAESQGCKIASVRVKENGLTWKLRCKVNGQRSKGSGEFNVDGDRGEGKARINFEMGGRRLAIVTKWDARHAGPCSETEDTAPRSIRDSSDEN